MENTAMKIANLLPNGKCSNCKTQVKISEPEYTVYKTRLVKQSKSTGTCVKCPNCGQMLMMS